MLEPKELLALEGLQLLARRRPGRAARRGPPRAGQTTLPITDGVLDHGLLVGRQRIQAGGDDAVHGLRERQLLVRPTSAQRSSRRTIRPRSSSIRTYSCAYSGLPWARSSSGCLRPRGQRHLVEQRRDERRGLGAPTAAAATTGARALPHAGRRSSSSGRAVQSTSSGVSVVHWSSCSMKSSSASSAQCRSSKTSTSGARPASASMNSLHAANASTCRSPPQLLAVLEPHQRPQLAEHPVRPAGRRRGDNSAAQLGAGGLGVVRVEDPRLGLHDLGQRPERDPVAVGQRRPLRKAISRGVGCDRARRARPPAGSCRYPGAPTTVTRRGVRRFSCTVPSADQSSSSCAAGRPAAQPGARARRRRWRSAGSAIQTATGSRLPSGSPAAPRW